MKHFVIQKLPTMSVNCEGCFPHYQENQMAHMYFGGCLYIDEIEFCQPVNLLNHFQEAENEPIMNSLTSEDNECVICYEVIGKRNNCVTPCGHAFCFNCLVSAMTRKNTCPCCRSELFALPSEDDLDSDGDYESDEDYDSDEDYEDELIPVELIADRLEKNGFTMLDVVSMLTNNYSKTNPTYTVDFISKMNSKYESLLEEIENEFDEQKKFAAEDIRV
jgi:hypothetical protein